MFFLFKHFFIRQSDKVVHEKEVMHLYEESLRDSQAGVGEGQKI